MAVGEQVRGLRVVGIGSEVPSTLSLEMPRRLWAPRVWVLGAGSSVERWGRSHHPAPLLQLGTVGSCAPGRAQPTGEDALFQEVMSGCVQCGSMCHPGLFQDQSSDVLILGSQRLGSACGHFWDRAWPSGALRKHRLEGSTGWLQELRPGRRGHAG